MAEILLDPVRLAYFLAIRELIGEGHDQFVDDMFTLQRRPAADRLAAELRRRRRDRPRAPGEIVWRFPVDGQRSDHMAHLARRQARRRLGLDRQRRPHPRHRNRPGGRALRLRRLAAREQLLRATASGSTTPASASSTRRPTSPPLDTHQGRALLPDRRRRHRPDHQADRHGPEARRGRLPEHELRGAADGALARRALRLLPGLLLPRLRRVRLRAATGCTRVANLPITPRSRTLPREQYLLDSAHHGIAMNGDGTKLCVAGTMSRLRGDRLAPRLLRLQAHPARGQKPYWSTDQRRRPLLLRLLERHRQDLGDLLRRPQGGRPHPGRRPPAADPHRAPGPGGSKGPAPALAGDAGGFEGVGPFPDRIEADHAVPAEAPDMEVAELVGLRTAAFSRPAVDNRDDNRVAGLDQLFG